MKYKVKFDNGCGDHFVAIVEAEDKKIALERGKEAAHTLGEIHWSMNDYATISVSEYIDENDEMQPMPWLLDWEEHDHELDYNLPKY